MLPNGDSFRTFDLGIVSSRVCCYTDMPSLHPFMRIYQDKAPNNLENWNPRVLKSGEQSQEEEKKSQREGSTDANELTAV